MNHFIMYQIISKTFAKKCHIMLLKRIKILNIIATSLNEKEAQNSAHDRKGLKIGQKYVTI